MWLQELGAEVAGVALAPDTESSHWQLLGLDISDYRCDIRDAQVLVDCVAAFRPSIIFHLAAQPLVRRSYQDPLNTWSTNVLGTVNVLETARRIDGVRAIVAITTDKCYENHEWPWGYREIDRLGGHDPYSASKAAAELGAASYRSAFFNSLDAPLLATARAGNVIGGGDWSEDRLIPDLVRAIGAGQSLEIRSPNATRPWQHVLESLSGYLMLGQGLLQNDRAFAEAWNFGPDAEDNHTVAEVLSKLKQHWPNIRWHGTDKPQPHEATLLYLDSAKARTRLHWQPVWQIDNTLAATANWYRAWLEQGQVTSRQQLADYYEAAARANIEWART